MHTSVHVAPGLGDLIGGWFVVPQNPVGGGRAGYVPSLGELMPGSYPMPQNPLMRGLSAVGAGGSGTGMGCGCGGGDAPSHDHGPAKSACGCGCNGQVSPWSAFRGLSGMGFLGLDDTTGDGISPIWLAGGALLAYLFLASPNRADKRADIASAKAGYARQRAKIQHRYSYRSKVGDKLAEKGLLAA